MKTALITGANKSIGFETARQLLQQGYHVFLGTRNAQRGQEAVEKLNAEGLTEVEAVALDVTDEASVQAARAAIGQKTDSLDVLINNAGISGGMPQSSLGAPVSLYEEVYATNVFGVVRVTQAFIDLLRKSPEPRIVNVSSSMGSLTRHSDPSWQFYNFKGAVYTSSKSALNMYTVNLAFDLKDEPFKVNAIDPGYIATDFNHHSGPGTVEQAGKRILKYATLGPDGPTGGFWSEENNPETWEIPW